MLTVEGFVLIYPVDLPRNLKCRRPNRPKELMLSNSIDYTIAPLGHNSPHVELENKNISQPSFPWWQPARSQADRKQQPRGRAKHRAQRDIATPPAVWTGKGSNAPGGRENGGIPLSPGLFLFNPRTRYIHRRKGL
ncbi:hypothetical protein CDAR_385941 [Caerostris darwini]|uniref:Uncharacterized protein n=1 Tax=Caerostris darwini TaxID=1538125 RepID=A0AAV4QER6_9ARAC|nr:hypothetical protein CDAR_385941 [Caerostris darwini]